MKHKAVVLGSLLALVVVLSLITPISRIDAQQPTTPQTLQVVIATRNLPGDTIITADMVAVCAWPVNSANDHVIAQTQDVVNRYARGAIAAGTPILISQVLDKPIVNPDWPPKPVVRPVQTSKTSKPGTTTAPKQPAFTCPKIDKLTKIVVAAQALPAEFTLNVADASAALTVLDWPAAAVPPGSFSDPEQAAGKIVQVDIMRGVPVQANMLGANLPPTYLGYPVVRIPFDTVTVLIEGKIKIKGNSYYTDIYAMNAKTKKYDQLIVKRVFLMTMVTIKSDRFFYFYVPEAAKRTALQKALKTKRALLALAVGNYVAH